MEVVDIIHSTLQGVHLCAAVLENVGMLVLQGFSGLPFWGKNFVGMLDFLVGDDVTSYLSLSPAD
jgi:hypothetical protein